MIHWPCCFGPGAANHDRNLWQRRHVQLMTRNERREEVAAGVLIFPSRAHSQCYNFHPIGPTF